MATSITTIQSTDLITNSRADINNNFDSLLVNKIETDTIDTDTTLAANSDAKIPSQKAVKAYVDGVGVATATTTVKGIVEVATQAEVAAGTATGSTGASLVVTPETLVGITSPVIRTYTTTTLPAAVSTQFDITLTGGTTYRYTYDGTGTDPGINATSVPTGAKIAILGQTFNFANCDIFTVTSSGTNYFEVTNASGVAETNKTLSTYGFIQVSIPQTWTKPAGLKYITVESVGGGAGGAGYDSDSSPGYGKGGASAGYVKKMIAASSLGATETVTVGLGGVQGDTSATPVGGKAGSNTTFGSHTTAGGGSASDTDQSLMTTGGTATGGDINLVGQPSGAGLNGVNSSLYITRGGDTPLGRGGYDSGASRISPTGYGAGGAGSYESGAGVEGSRGADGIVILTEYYV